MIEYEFLTSVVTDEDITDIRRLLKESVLDGTDITPEHIVHVARRNHLLVAREAEPGLRSRIVGAGILATLALLTGGVGRIEGITVSPTHVEFGLADGLVLRLIEQARHIGLTRVVLDSSSFELRTALRLDELAGHLGFVRHGTDELLLELNVH
ncbi:GNAT family N-acetyltransferase [Candidatus Uhrbacteria bacterium]|nr:GNAT family N-acetyltransferase [Candidatus Uhrbacteria bacterium]